VLEQLSAVGHTGIVIAASPSRFPDGGKEFEFGYEWEIPHLQFAPPPTISIAPD
jgi:hypothetical protein